MEMLPFIFTNSSRVGHKTELLLTGLFTPLTITEASGLPIAQPQQRPVSTTCVAAAPSVQGLLSCPGEGGG